MPAPSHPVRPAQLPVLLLQRPRSGPPPECSARVRGPRRCRPDGPTAAPTPCRSRAGSRPAAPSRARCRARPAALGPCAPRRWGHPLWGILPVVVVPRRGLARRRALRHGSALVSDVLNLHRTQSPALAVDRDEHVESAIASADQRRVSECSEWSSGASETSWAMRGCECLLAVRLRGYWIRLLEVPCGNSFAPAAGASQKTLNVRCGAPSKA